MHQLIEIYQAPGFNNIKINSENDSNSAIYQQQKPK